MGGSTKRSLFCRTLFISLLLTLSRDELCTCQLAGRRFLVEFIAGVFDFVDTRRFSSDMLLLPKSLLSLFLSLASRMRCARCIPQLYGRDSVSFSAAEKET